MTISWIAFSKLCFLLSVTFCAFLLLLIPGFHLLRRPGDLQQLHQSLPANTSSERTAVTQLTNFGALKPPVSVSYVYKNDTVSRFPNEMEGRTLGRWFHHDRETQKPYFQVGVEEEEEDSHLVPGPGEEAVDAVKDLQPLDVFIAVKTTRKYHKSRVELLLQTWISRAKEQTFIFTDGEDHELRQKAGDHLINTNCSAVHTRQALCCKMSVEYDKFLESGRKWFCHVDDDNYINMGSLLRLLSSFSHTQDIYLGRPSLDHPVEAAEKVKSDGSTSVKFWFATGGAGFCISRGLALKMSPWASLGNFISTAEKVRLPDDCTIGYIIEALLEVKMIHSQLFHSHLENLQQLPTNTVLNQVTLSYGGPENRRNVVSVGGAFSLEKDPTRFRSVHCLLYPDTAWCPSKRRLGLKN